jgi:type II secretion system protein N
MAIDWIKNPRIVKVSKVVGAVLFGLVVFVFSIGYTLPEERLRSYIESKAAQSGINLSIEEVSAGGFGALSIIGFHAALPPSVTEATDGSRIETPRSFDFDRVDVDLSLLSVIFGSPSLSVVIKDGDGHMGPIKVKAETATVSVEIEEIVDFPVPEGFPLGPLPLSGLIKSGSGKLLWDNETGIGGSEGTFELTAENLVAVKPVLNTKQAGAIALTDIVMGRLEASIVIDKRSNITALKGGRRGGAAADGRVIYFEKLKIDGTDISAMIEGNSMIRLMPGRPVSKGQMTVELAFAIDDAFYEKVSKGSDEKPNKFLKTLLDMDPKWRSARSGRFVGLMCTGTVDKPSCIPKKPSVRGGDFKVPAKDIDGEEGEESAPKPARRQPARPRPAPVRQVVPPPAVEEVPAVPDPMYNNNNAGDGAVPGAQPEPVLNEGGAENKSLAPFSRRGRGAAGVDPTNTITAATDEESAKSRVINSASVQSARDVLYEKLGRMPPPAGEPEEE